MKARSCTDSCSMRVLSPRIEPPDTLLDGSTANTATRWPCAISHRPSASMKVLLPTPGTPLMPSRKAPPACGSSASSSASARTRWSARVDSSSVMALAMARRWRARSPVDDPSRSSVSAASSMAVTGSRRPGRRAGGSVRNRARRASARVGTCLHREPHQRASARSIRAQSCGPGHISSTVLLVLLGRRVALCHRAALICSSTSFALAGIGVPGP